VEGNWRAARSSSYVGVSLGDYVRRLALSWPLVAMGTSGGAIVVAKLGAEAPDSTQQVVVGVAPEGSHPAEVGDEDQAIALELLHGDYDGGVRLKGRDHTHRMVVWLCYLPATLCRGTHLSHWLVNE